MSNFTTLRLNEDELTSPSSDEKMDTGSESFRSQDTPNSILSDFEERDQEPGVLRLQNPEDQPDKPCFNDSLITKMSNLKIDSPKTDGRPRNLGISPPRFSSTLTLTTNHPLMGLGSPDENFPDVIPKKLHKIEDEKDLSLSSIEDDRLNSTCFYSPQRNTSKNNLYFSENFVTAESQILNDSLEAVPPDVARVDKVERRKITAKFNESNNFTPLKLGAKNDSAISNCVEKRITSQSQSTPKYQSPAIDVTREEFHSGVAEWCESPSHLRSMPNFELPIEMSTSIRINNGLDSPDAISSSTQEDRSAYQALLDPYTGNVALRHTAPRSPHNGTLQRRKIQLPPEDDRCSLDSISVCSMESEEEVPEPPQKPHPPGAKESSNHVEQAASDDEDTKRSVSTSTVSTSSSPIPEYSLAEELSNERAWRDVPRHPQGHSTCDMKVIEPFKRVLSHGGYDGCGAALIVFSACHLPDSARPDYTYVMDNLFLYVIWTLERLVTEQYVLVYLHASAARRRLPTFHWLHECYKLIDRRLRKSLKHLYLVHPTFWLKSFVILTKPFVSSKFMKKLSYVRSLSELMSLVPLEPNAIPDSVKRYDQARTQR